MFEVLELEPSDDEGLIEALDASHERACRSQPGCLP
jgi:hypothetical protein